MGMASEAKASTLLGQAGPRDGAGLSLLHREVLPAPLAAELAGVAHRPVLDDSFLAAIPRTGTFGAMVAAEVAVYLQSTLLPDADSFSMASSVELRVPFVDRHVFLASSRSFSDKRIGPGKSAFGLALDDSYIRKLANGCLKPLLSAAADPDAVVWSVVDRDKAERTGLIPLDVRDGWTKAWLLAALNAWLETIIAE
jgi:asparagine synthase (glutamine-hydrolysing)